MEHPRDPYHVRPFPQQPHRGGKALVKALDDLETALGQSAPNHSRLREIQALIHQAANTSNDDKLVDMIRQMSMLIDEFEKGNKTLVDISGISTEKLPNIFTKAYLENVSK